MIDDVCECLFPRNSEVSFKSDIYLSAGSSLPLLIFLSLLETIPFYHQTENLICHTYLNTNMASEGIETDSDESFWNDLDSNPLEL